MGWGPNRCPKEWEVEQCELAVGHQGPCRSGLDLEKRAQGGAWTWDAQEEVSRIRREIRSLRRQYHAKLSGFQRAMEPFLAQLGGVVQHHCPVHGFWAGYKEEPCQECESAREIFEEEDSRSDVIVVDL